MQDQPISTPLPPETGHGSEGTVSQGWRDEIRATYKLAWPLVLANLLQMLIWAIDVFFVARLGEFELAASSLAVALFSILGWATITLVSVVSALIAAELGRSRFAIAEVRRSVRMAIWLSVICGMLVMLVLSQAEAILLASGQRPELAARAFDYMGIVMWAMVPLLVASVLRNFVSTLGRPIFATAITALAIGVNALGNYMLVFGNFGAPALGLEGSAIATIMTSIFIVLAYVVAIHRDRRLRRYFIWGRFWRPEWERLRDLVALGLPVFFTTIAEAGLFGGAALLMGLIGESQLAGHTIALQIAAFAFQVPFGVSQAATIRVGYHYGARNHAAIRRAGAVALVMAVGFMSFTASLMLLFPEPILGLYIDTAKPANAAMMAFALQYIVIAALFQLVDGLQVVAAGALRGLQDTRVPMWMAIFSYWVPGFGTSYYLGFHTSLEGIGVWLGFAVGLTSATLLLTGRWLMRERLGLADRPARSG